MKRIIKLTESQLKTVIDKIVTEQQGTPPVPSTITYKTVSNGISKLILGKTFKFTSLNQDPGMVKYLSDKTFHAKFVGPIEKTSTGESYVSIKFNILTEAPTNFYNNTTEFECNFISDTGYSAVPTGVRNFTYSYGVGVVSPMDCPELRDIIDEFLKSTFSEYIYDRGRVPVKPIQRPDAIQESELIKRIKRIIKEQTESVPSKKLRRK